MLFAKLLRLAAWLCWGADKDALKKFVQQDKIDEGVIVHKKTGASTKMVYTDGLYKYPMWVRRRVRKESVNSGLESQNKKVKILNSIDVGNVEGELDEQEIAWAPF